MSAYDYIAAIYNPNSTNDAKLRATKFKDAAKKRGVTVHLHPTDHRGHARTYGYDFTLKHKRPLLISVSGDGGYNELVDGVMAAKRASKSRRPVVAVIGAGNANDHKRTTRGDTPLIKLIDKEPKTLDLLRMQSKGVDRYAHSYIGLGITPEVGMELNRHTLSPGRELFIAWQAFWKFRPFTIKRSGKKEKFSSIIFANINGMAKVIRLNESTGVRDGKFDLIAFPYKGKLHLAFELFRSALFGNSDAPEYSRYTFRTTHELAVQLDGEIETVPANTEVKITSEKEAIESLY